MVGEINLHLVEAIEQAMGYFLPSPIRQAFLTVDRRCFVPRYYEQAGQQWVERETGAEIYENRAFFTRLDARGIPNSSSSQPSLMAPMLEALTLFAGACVLEIGTGTGYNTALLAEIVGQTGRVMSVDIAADVVEQAAVRLSRWSWVETAPADGLLGYPARAPYARIMATGASATIPAAWLAQLAVGGILVGNLALRLSTATPIYRLVKHEDGTASGSLLITPAFFMGLYQVEQHAPPPPDFALYEAMPRQERGTTTLNVARLLKNSELALFVQQRLPDLEWHLRSHRPTPRSGRPVLESCLLLPGRGLLSFCPKSDASTVFQVEERGEEDLWPRLFALFMEWEKLGRPALDRFRIVLDQDAHLTLLLP